MSPTRAVLGFTIHPPALLCAILLGAPVREILPPDSGWVYIVMLTISQTLAGGKFCDFNPLLGVRLLISSCDTAIEHKPPDCPGREGYGSHVVRRRGRS